MQKDHTTNDISRKPPEAIIFDLLTALLDSWTLWNHSAGSPTSGHEWRLRYLQLTYGAGKYVPYEDLVSQAASDVKLPASAPQSLLENWQGLRPWPEAVGILRALKRKGYKLAVVTNCSVELGRKAAALCGVHWDAVVTAEEVGFYKPAPECYRTVLEMLGVEAEEAVFVAGSASDVPGAAGVGMRVLWHNRVGLSRVGDSGGEAEDEQRDLKTLLQGLL